MWVGNLGLALGNQYNRKVLCLWYYYSPISPLQAPDCKHQTKQGEEGPLKCISNPFCSRNGNLTFLRSDQKRHMVLRFLPATLASMFSLHSNLSYSRPSPQKCMHTHHIWAHFSGLMSPSEVVNPYHPHLLKNQKTPYHLPNVGCQAKLPTLSTLSILPRVARKIHSFSIHILAIYSL